VIFGAFTFRSKNEFRSDLGHFFFQKKNLGCVCIVSNHFRVVSIFQSVTQTPFLNFFFLIFIVKKMLRNLVQKIGSRTLARKATATATATATDATATATFDIAQCDLWQLEEGPPTTGACFFSGFWALFRLILGFISAILGFFGGFILALFWCFCYVLGLFFGVFGVFGVNLV
jgi:hypothetical protein